MTNCCEKIDSYKRYIDPAGEISEDDLRAASSLTVTTDPAALSEASFIIIAVPTPVNQAHQPDFGPLVAASGTVGRFLQRVRQ